jgi:hypothetical protein
MKTMTCWEFDEAVHRFVRMELLDVSLREAVVEHAAHCDNCAQRMAEAGELAEVTEAAAASARELQAPVSVETALLSAYRNHRWRRRTTLWRTLEWAAAGAAAAMLAVVLWTSATGSKVRPSPAPKGGASSPSNRPLDAAGPAASQPEDASQGTELEASIADAGEAYSKSDFVPVPFTDGMGPEDPGMVVRVQLTRSSLAELGYPVAETPDEDLIRADVLVGEDGWPRGVRVVP